MALTVLLLCVAIFGVVLAGDESSCDEHRHQDRDFFKALGDGITTVFIYILIIHRKTELTLKNGVNYINKAL